MCPRPSCLSLLRCTNTGGTRRHPVPLAAACRIGGWLSNRPPHHAPCTPLRPGGAVGTRGGVFFHGRVLAVAWASIPCGPSLPALTPPVTVARAAPHPVHESGCAVVGHPAPPPIRVHAFTCGTYRGPLD